MLGDAILEWADGRPRWQRVALRMLTETEALSDQQVDTLAAIALQDVGVDVTFGAKADCVELSDAHLGGLSAGRGNVCLLAISDAQHVNRLAPDQRLDFAANGLTVVYGPNGSGKSGYARIIKRTSGARLTGGMILPDVFEAEAVNGASAVLKYSVDGDEAQATWSDGEGLPAVLPEVGFFDGPCGHLHVSKDNAVLFTPAGLELLHRMTSVCERVRLRIRSHLAELQAAAPLPNIPDDFRGTIAWRVVNGLSAATDVDQITRSIPLSDAERTELERLQVEESADPQSVAAKCTLVDRSLEPPLNAVVEILEAVSDEALIGRRDRVTAVEVARKAAETASKDLFADEPLPDVGTDVWAKLWEAARTYSTEKAYPGLSFPVVDAGAVCPLCLRPLDEESTARFVKFEQHVRAESEHKLQEARRVLLDGDKAWDVARQHLRSTRANLPALRTEDAALADAIDSLISAVEGLEEYPCREEALQLRGDLQTLHAAMTSARAALAATKAGVLSAADPERAKVRRDRIIELRGRQWLTGRLEALVARVPVLVTAEAARAADSSCDTTAPSRFVTRLAEEYVTEAQQKAFADELKALGVRLPLILTRTGTHKAVPHHQVQLGPAPAVELPLVLSEGEQKCVALAAFLSEADIREDTSGMVFDDPVTSLDHRWRDGVARRLVGEAQRRQVIVFTHDIVFLMDLVEACRRIGHEPQTINLTCGADKVGMRLDGLPWGGMTVKQRVGVLRQHCQKAAAVLRKVGYEEYAPHAARIYGLMRETWERGVEEVLLNNVVVRLRRNVETQRLSKLTDICGDDLTPVEQGMSKCSTYMVGHDEAAGLQEEMPYPDELETDIDALEQWVNALRPRR